MVTSVRRGRKAMTLRPGEARRRRRPGPNCGKCKLHAGGADTEIACGLLGSAFEGAAGIDFRQFRGYVVEDSPAIFSRSRKGWAHVARTIPRSFDEPSSQRPSFRRTAVSERCRFVGIAQPRSDHQQRAV